jgi:hypothetical protein
MIVLTVPIKGYPYKVYLLEPKKYILKHKDNSLAHLHKTDKEIVFRKDHVDKKIIIHEVTHAFINQCHLASCDNLDVEDFEEIVCELMEDHIQDIINIANLIYKELKYQVKPKRRKNGRKG